MTKREKFLDLVEKALQANEHQADIDRFPSDSPAQRAEDIMHDAVDSSDRIPENLTAEEAALIFCTYEFHNLNKMEERKTGKKVESPDWVTLPSLLPGV